MTNHAIKGTKSISYKGQFPTEREKTEIKNSSFYFVNHFI